MGQQHQHRIVALLLSVLFVHGVWVRTVHGLIVPNRLFGWRGPLVTGRDAASAPTQVRAFWPNSIYGRKCQATKRAASLTNDGREPPNEKGSNRDPETPKKWTAETTPLQVVQYYAREGVTDEQITACLAEHNITSLEKLKANGWVVGPLIMDGVYGDLSDSITVALKRNKKTATDVLGGTLIHDVSCISQSQLDLYTEKAVSVSYRAGEEFKVRCPSISLVMGPSGSGKTMFALKNLPRIALPKAKSDKEIFRLHVRAKTLLGDEPNTKIDLCARLVAHVKEMVAKKLRDIFGTNEPPPIDLFLFVTIDEAGRTEFKDYFDQADKIDNLVYALGNMTGYTFEKGVHVAVAGTALETTTAGIDSVGEAKKYHMQPWSPSNFHALLDMLHRKDQTEVKQIVERFHILNSLITNARCAFFLADTMPNITITNEARWAGYVDLTVPKVAYCYIETNILQSLVTPDRRFTVAQEVFQAIDTATRQPNVAYFPNFDHIDSPNLRSCIKCLLDSHAELVDGEMVLPKGSVYSVSMTPAIMIVLAELLCTKTQVCWDWRDFGNAVALGEWKRMIANMNPSDFTDASGIIQLRSPVPGSISKTKFALPLVGCSTVLLNGRDSAYADVMAPFRLVRTKFSVDPNQVLELNFEEEMDEMGLTNAKDYELQQATTSALYFMWRKEFQCNGYGMLKVDPFQNLGYREDARSEHYPCQMLLSGDIRGERNVMFFADVNRGTVRPIARKGGANLTKQPVKMKILEEFTTSQPVTAVFVTNAATIVIKSRVSEGNGSDRDLANSMLTIGRDDVDWQGVLKKPLPNYLYRNVRENVDVRFMLY